MAQKQRFHCQVTVACTISTSIPEISCPRWDNKVQLGVYFQTKCQAAQCIFIVGSVTPPTQTLLSHQTGVQKQPAWQVSSGQPHHRLDFNRNLQK